MRHLQAFTVLLVACGLPESSPLHIHRPTLQFAELPDLVVELHQPVNPAIRLARRLLVTADRPVSLTITLEAEEAVRSVTFDGFAVAHTLPILELHADSTYEVTVVATDEEGLVAIERGLSFTTHPLPTRWPLMDVLVHAPGAMSPGYTLLDFKGAEPPVNYAVILDTQLEPIWIYESDEEISDARMLPAGHLLMVDGVDVVETDLVGNEYGPWTNIPTPIHHEAFPLPDGGLATLATYATVLNAFPEAYLSPRVLSDNVAVSDDVVLLFDAALTPVAAWPMRGTVDPKRIGFHSLNEVDDGYDWVHANAVVRDSTDGGYLVSLRHQDCVVKLDSGGELQWILGNHEGWSAAFAPYLLESVGADFAWSYHQHAPMVTVDDLILLYDNGNFGYTPYSDEAVPLAEWYSRAVAYRVDPEAMTVSQEWEVEQSSTGRLFSGGLGDADELANGNVLVVHGWVLEENGVQNADAGRGQTSARLVESTVGGQIALDIRIWGNLGDEPDGWQVSRAERFSGLYPGR